MIVLQYIYSCSKRFQTFVANRLSVIHDGSRPRQWRKVGTKENPADDGFDMISSDRWKRGPEFHWQDETAWPTNPAVPEIACEDEEVKKQVKCCVSNVQHDAGDRGKHGMPRADKGQESEDPIIPLYRELLLLASSEKECGLAASQQGVRKGHLQ